MPIFLASDGNDCTEPAVGLWSRCHEEVDDLLTVGLLPWTPMARIRMVGNAAGAGAVMAAINPRLRKEASTFAEQVQVVELASQPDFQNIFLDSLSFPNRCKA